MTRAWEKLDLEGSGLQGANRRLVRRLKKPITAYLLWFLFPLGAHRIYLEKKIPALAYAGLSALSAVLYLSHAGWIAVAPAVIAIGWALYDLVWIDRRITRLNKQIRMAEYLRPAGGAPAGFQGHYTDDTGLAGYIQEKERERGGHAQAPQPTARPGKRAPSFAEQEKMLRELTRK